MHAKETSAGAPVSVLMPLYNGRAHLLEAGQSIVQQSMLPRELIVVDDGSTDDGASLLERLAVPFQLTVVRQDNRGQSAARNRAASVATQPYLAFLDQDDLWMSDHLEVLLKGISHS